MDLIVKQKGHINMWLTNKSGYELSKIPIILHAGMEKTGTKAIQNWLAINREGLKNEGWWIPNSLGQKNHRIATMLGYDLNRRDDATQRRGIKTKQQLRAFQDEVQNKLSEEINLCRQSNCKAILISSELASSRLITVREIYRLFSKLRMAGCGPILVLMFRRDPIKLIESRHRTAIECEGWTERHPPRPGHPQADLFGDQIRLVRQWNKACGLHQDIDLDILWYAKDTLKKSSSVMTIAELLDCQDGLKSTAEDVQANESGQLPWMTYKRWRNMIDKERKNNIMNSEIQEKRKNLLVRFLPKWKYQLPLERVNEYRDAYQKSFRGKNEKWLSSSTWCSNTNPEN